LCRAEALKEAADARRWRDASPAERIEFEIEDLGERLGLLCAFAPERAKLVMERIAELQAELQGLNVS
jgi:hypothetical protein